MMHSSTIPASMPARRTASFTTIAPSSVAAKFFRAPRNFPVGVRTADTMTDSRTADLDRVHGVGAEEPLQARENHRRRSHDFARPLGAGRLDEERAVGELHRRDAAERGPDGGVPCEGDLAVRQRRRLQQLGERAGDGVRDRAHRKLVQNSSMRLILASASPRRAELLRAAGYAFDVAAPDVDESPGDGESPPEYVRRLAAEKSAAIAAQAPAGAIVLGADTTVVVDNEILAKPRDDADAR